MSLPASPSAEAITHASKSNLALAFISLPRERKRDITTFYAFCRIVDDIADSSSHSPAEKQTALDLWKRAIEAPVEQEPALAPEIRALIERYNIPREHLREIIAGVEMDIHPRRFETWDDLRIYCYRVASAVGLASIEIFGYRNAACREYAIQLGLALQITNILRDVRQDFKNGGRIYLPRMEMAQFGYTEDDLRGATYDARFIALMDFEASRAWKFYAEAEELLPAEDRRAMVAAEIMRRVYARLLRKMQRDRFRVFEKRYKLSRVEKLLAIAPSFLPFRC